MFRCQRRKVVCCNTNDVISCMNFGFLVCYFINHCLYLASLVTVITAIQIRSSLKMKRNLVACSIIIAMLTKTMVSRTSLNQYTCIFSKDCKHCSSEFNVLCSCNHGKCVKLWDYIDNECKTYKDCYCK